MPLERQARRIIAIGGGKGGVGKSVLATAFAQGCAENGLRTVLIDLDLGMGNLHGYLGITQRTVTVADFLQKKIAKLSDTLVPTATDNLLFCSGAEFVPGLANPPYWLKQKLLRHIRALEADMVIMDLGAGVSFNTLDFFDAADRGIIVTAPEPAAVMNAYAFLKGALFRKLQSVFRHHDELGSVVEADLRKPESERVFNLEWLKQQAHAIAADALPLIGEVEASFQAALIVNRHTARDTDPVIRNLLLLCQKNLGMQLELIAQVPEAHNIRRYLMNIPGLLHDPSEKVFAQSIQGVVQTLRPRNAPAPRDYSDEELQQIIALVDGLDAGQLEGRDRKAWKLRVYFKPHEVDALLQRHGIERDAFLE